MLEEQRRFLSSMLQAGLAAVDGRAATRAALRNAVLPASVAVFAIGKAAASMTRGAADALGPALRTALVITRDGHAQQLQRELPQARLVESAHPLPDARSLAAGAALLDAVRSLPAEVFPLFLVSGGASSLVEVLRPGITLAQLQQCNAQGLAGGLDIVALNHQRAGLSLLKGGGLTTALQGRAALALFISDVPDDSPDVIGSGLLGSCNAVDRLERRIVASVDDARRAVAAAARSAGCAAGEPPARFAGDAVEQARQCVAQLRAAPPGLIVWGGESTVQLPAHPGHGGRNQHLALAAAIGIEGDDELLLLAAGTDGNDGNTDDAGALVDGHSCARMRAQGIEPQRALDAADAGSALAESCDLIHTGPTGTNVGDLILGLRLPRGASRHAASPAGMV